MKTILYVFFVAMLGAALAESPKEKLHQYSNDCKAESGVSDEVLSKIRNGEHVTEDPKLKEHGFCVLKKAGFIDANGQLQVGTIRTKFNEASPGKTEKIEKFITKCAVQKATPQDTAANFWICSYKAVKEAKAH